MQKLKEYLAQYQLPVVFATGEHLGRHNPWSMAQGKLKSTGEEATVLFHQNEAMDAGTIDYLKLDAISLCRYRHPGIVSPLIPLYSSPAVTLIAIRPVSTILQSTTSSPAPCTTLDPCAELRLKLSLPEVLHGLRDLQSTVEFLHSQCRIAHLNICPSTIYVDRNGKWLLGGFLCSAPIQDRLGGMLNNSGAVGGTSIYNCFDGSTSLDECDRLSLSIIAKEYLLCVQGLIPPPGGVSVDLTRTDPVGIKLAREFLERQSRKHLSHQELEVVHSLIRGPTGDPNKGAGVADLPVFKSKVMTIYEGFDEFHKKPVYEQLRFLEHILQDPYENSLGRDRQTSINISVLKDGGDDLMKASFINSHILPSLLTCISSDTSCRDFSRIMPRIIYAILQCVKLDHKMYHTRVWPYLKKLLSAREIGINAVTQILKEVPFLLSLDPAQESVWIQFVVKCISINEATIQSIAIQQLPRVIKNLRPNTLDTALNTVGSIVASTAAVFGQSSQGVQNPGVTENRVGDSQKSTGSGLLSSGVDALVATLSTAGIRPTTSSGITLVDIVKAVCTTVTRSPSAVSATGSTAGGAAAGAGVTPELRTCAFQCFHELLSVLDFDTKKDLIVPTIIKIVSDDASTQVSRAAVSLCRQTHWGFSLHERVRLLLPVLLVVISHEHLDHDTYHEARKLLQENLQQIYNVRDVRSGTQLVSASQIVVANQLGAQDPKPSMTQGRTEPKEQNGSANRQLQNRTEGGTKVGPPKYEKSLDDLFVNDTSTDPFDALRHL
ncbi:hypothetical protein GNI_049240 [Gregarina niphandrodes]|uniref:Protein kinase domain-containing protein n=1 Tax=Gregarina niphandrodes TaxID=110365 RepID=A0A023B9L0_GRENI|nr:hypothetical protein GNI_049240 [Gregarina niphandrodes]EZG73068.1 hypothetical protein GNI_049240 [Gregarina niphandrodes]|eukprot:XP_011129660.1 hypothetical protein GNI_049240 [Gregarina niphandrodes]